MRTDGRFLKDEWGRTLLLRGVNLGGSSKVPTVPDGATHLAAGFFQHRAVSFVGRPFPLAEADTHFRRLAAWGLSFLRFVVTWEAIEHAGPGQYDEEYLDYLHAVIGKAHAHGIRVYIDPHQDVWGRHCGGDGAPGWTLEAVGFDVTRLHESGAAYVHQCVGGVLPGLIWPTNATKLAAATMYTLFFAGDDFAPRLRIAGESAQHYLQRHYVAALCRVAARLRDLPNVVGYGSMNEPMAGFIGLRLDEVPGGMLKKGPSPSPLQSMLLGAGIPQRVEVWELSASHMGRVGEALQNEGGVRAWRDGADDVWRAEGVYSDEGPSGAMLRPDHFLYGPKGRPVDFAADYLKPFCVAVIRALRQVVPDTLLFFEGPPVPVGKPPPWSVAAGDPGGVVHAPHWYDGLTLFTKHFARDLTLDMTTMVPVFGADAVRACYAAQLCRLRDQLPQLPTLLGEFGLNFDLDGGAGFHSGDFRDQIDALDGYYAGVEAALISCTQWNYTADNSHTYGDGWNAEDMSIFCPEERCTPDDIHAGGRALDAIVRPYLRAAAGEPLRQGYDLQTRRFELALRPDRGVTAPSEVFVPLYPYPRGYRFDVQGGTFTTTHRDGYDVVLLQPGDGDVLHAQIRPA